MSKEVHTFSKSISSKLNVIAQLKFELPNYNYYLSTYLLIDYSSNNVYSYADQICIVSYA